ncbi:MAG: N-acetyl-gamma-glutamyl-phosphate reductase [Actinomycetota bacterium]|nr:N-acetyl-gamma-glutamyl-phosphate reductase [Actinomycetota bacterium]
MISVGIIGASGYTGAELLRICSKHPNFEVKTAVASTLAGTSVSDVHVHLSAEFPEMLFEDKDSAPLSECEIIFTGLPHGASQKIIPEFLGTAKLIVDLGADFRLRDADIYKQWYEEDHVIPELLDSASYGLPELFRDGLENTSLVAAPGCYPTAASLALAPFIRAGVIESEEIIVDAASGASGAGKNPQPSSLFCSVDENFSAYGLLTHRHTPEIEQVLSTASNGSLIGNASVLFTPHLAPMNRGILATCYGRVKGALDTDAALQILTEAYAGMPFIVVSEKSPTTKSTFGSNAAHLTARVDPRTGLLVSFCAIDNLGKGASGQAVQCANIVLGLDESDGLSAIGISP